MEPLVSLHMLVKRVSSLIRILVESVALVKDPPPFPRKFLAREIVLRFWSGQETSRQRSELHTMYLK